MAKNIITKFETLVRKLNYNQIQLESIDCEAIKRWSYKNMPGVVDELEELGWDLSNDRTWSETVFINVVLKWYNKRIALFLTPSLLDYTLAHKVLRTKTFARFREEYNIHTHSIVLINPIIFLVPEDLDALYVGFDFDKGYSFIDFSHFDEEDDLDPEYVNDWQWLSVEEGDPIEWTSYQIKKVFTS